MLGITIRHIYLKKKKRKEKIANLLEYDFFFINSYYSFSIFFRTIFYKRLFKLDISQDIIRLILFIVCTFALADWLVISFNNRFVQLKFRLSRLIQLKFRLSWLNQLKFRLSRLILNALQFTYEIRPTRWIDVNFM